jgi:diadenosine tetraphosphate (Ap4A) HIT family hydrolase
VSSCVFCAIAAGEKTDEHVVAADEHTVAFLDIRPVFKGARRLSELLPGDRSAG